MATANSKTDICNLALDLLLQSNEDDVTNIDNPTTQTEVTCARWYDTTRRSVLRDHPWNFATKRVVLTESASKPDFGVAAAFNLPNDFIRVSTIYSPRTQHTIKTESYEVENGQLLLLSEYESSTTSSELNLRYIYDITDVGQFDPSFVQYLVAELAVNMAYKFTSSNSQFERLASLRNDRRRSARSIDGQERPPRRIERSKARARRRRLGSNERTSILFD